VASVARGERAAQGAIGLEEAVREGEERYRALVERLPAIVYLAEFGHSGAWRYVSPQVKPILGYTQEEWLTGDGLWGECIHPEDRAAAIEREHEAEASGTHLSSEYRMYTRDGRLVWIRDEASVISDQGDRVLQGFMYDITALKEAEALVKGEQDVLEQTVEERTRALDESRLEILQRLALAAEYRDDNTHQHTQRVGRTAGLVAVQMGLPESQAEALRRAAPLHDIGKIGIPDALLLKNTGLTPEEFELVKKHTTIGARILAGSRFEVLQMAEEIALTHHEQWEGGGYPRGLRAEEIPLAGRITTIADVFDGLTHERPYKPAWPLDRTLAEIDRLTGTHFDPEVAAAFRTLDHAALIQPIEG
jgi:putative two-component system response regulator